MKKTITAKRYYSGFDLARDTYNSLSLASDGKIYYVLSSESLYEGGKFCVYDPATDSAKILADLTQVCGETNGGMVPQGKSHVEFYESNGKLYFGTHVSFYETIAGMERLPQNPPDGVGLYPGGHILSYDLASGEFRDLAIAPHGEGILTMTMDAVRGYIFAITWPRGFFISYQLKTDELLNHGPVSENGEAGVPGDDYRVLCRSMFVDPGDGAVYLSTSEGAIQRFHPSAGKPETLTDVDMRLDYFGTYDPTRSGSMAYNWRKIQWCGIEEAAYGVHGNSGYLFRFDPRKPSIELVERITSERSKKSGMFDQFTYGYLGFQLGPDGETLYYLTGGPVYLNGKRVKGAGQLAKGASRGVENLHLVTYNIREGKYLDHGPVFYPDGARPTCVNSIALGVDHTVYALARFEHDGRTIQDLIKFPDPIGEK